MFFCMICNQQLWRQRFLSSLRAVFATAQLADHAVVLVYALTVAVWCFMHGVCVQMDKFLNKSARRHVHLGQLFSCIGLLKLKL